METFLSLGMSLGLGLLIGLQRERSDSHLGGIRTFPLISLFGTVCGLLAVPHGVWLLVAGFFVVFGVLGVSNLLNLRQETSERGQTTEVAALLTFALGAYLVDGSRAVAFVVAGVIVILLHLKGPMHRFVNAMGERDMAAVMQFVVISLIVWPLLPNRNYGPYAVLNPFDIWRMVVLIVGISLAGYVAYKILGERAGTILGGMLGGLISSTATTVSYARRSKGARHAQFQAAFVIMVASTIAFVRVLVEITAVAPGRLGELAPPLIAMFVWMSLIAGVVFFIYRGTAEEMPEPGNPAELKGALVFGGLYALVLLAIGAAKDHFGSTALYGVALLSGLADMDAITLSVARMVEQDRVAGATGWRLILAAALANLAFKGAVVALLGDRRLALRVAVLFAIAALGGLAIISWWPEAWSLAPAARRNE